MKLGSLQRIALQHSLYLENSLHFNSFFNLLFLSMYYLHYINSSFGGKFVLSMHVQKQNSLIQFLCFFSYSLTARYATQANHSGIAASQKKPSRSVNISNLLLASDALMKSLPHWHSIL